MLLFVIFNINDKNNINNRNKMNFIIPAVGKIKLNIVK